MAPLDSAQKFADEFAAAVQDAPFIILLCGPALSDEKPSAQLRQRLLTSLKRANFEVFLGEDEGLEDNRLKTGINAQDNELEFARTKCNAIIIIADSVGSYCELGLFSWHFSHDDGVLKNDLRTDCIVLIDKKYKKEKSYLNLGPSNSVKHLGGHVEYVDFGKYNLKNIIERLRQRRSVLTLDNRRGRPRGPK